MRSLRLVIAIASPLLCAGLGLVATTASAIAQAQDHQYTTSEIQSGSRLYSAQCALCHGNNGDGIAGVNLARQQFRRGSTDDDIKNIVTTGVAAARISPFLL